MTGRARLPLVALALVLGFGLSGCAGTGEMARMGHGMARAHPEARLHAGYAFSAGPSLLGIVRRSATSDTLSAELLRQVRRVSVGYFPAGRSLDARRMAMPAPLRRYTQRGWEHVATVRDDSAAVWVLARERGERLTDLFVATWTDEQLVLVRVTGDLTEAALIAAQAYAPTRLGRAIPGFDPPEASDEAPATGEASAGGTE